MWENYDWRKPQGQRQNRECEEAKGTLQLCSSAFGAADPHEAEHHLQWHLWWTCPGCQCLASGTNFLSSYNTIQSIKCLLSFFRPEEGFCEFFVVVLFLIWSKPRIRWSINNPIHSNTTNTLPSLLPSRIPCIYRVRLKLHVFLRVWQDSWQKRQWLLGSAQGRDRYF